MKQGARERGARSHAQRAGVAHWRLLPALLLGGLFLTAGFLLREEAWVATSCDAILWLAEDHANAAGGDLYAAEKSGHDIPTAPAGPSREAELEVARAELTEYVASLESARQAIEDAVIMVREQKENFDFAEDRYTTLMPLVETGALEPLAASQIQSAYISARASLAQAKFFLSQARRDFGTEQGRRWRLRQLQERVAMLEGTSAAGGLAAEFFAEEAVENSTADSGSSSSRVSRPFVEAYFAVNPAAKNIQQGQIAAISAPAWNGPTASAVVAEKTEVLGPDNRVRIFVRLEFPADVALPSVPARRALPVRVEIAHGSRLLDSALP